MELKLGLQLYSVRQNMAKDPAVTIAKVAQIGYKYLETANLAGKDDYGCGFGTSARAIKEIITKYGISIFSAHVYPLDMDNIEKVLDYYAELGATYINSKPLYGRLDEVKREADLYNRIGEKILDRGMKHSIHSAMPPYCEDGSFAFDRMAEYTDPDKVLFEIDTYWITRAGFDPVDVIKKHKDRVVIIHQKDMPADFHGVLNLNALLPKGEKPIHDFFAKNVQHDEFCEIGTGTMNIQEIIDTTVQYTKATHIVLEQDFSKYDEFESVRISMEHFKKYKNITC